MPRWERDSSWVLLSANARVMKPNFALTLSLEGIRLLQRAPSGWLLVGDVAFDAKDLAQSLKSLRDAAERIAPGKVSCKLVIPNEQIKYMTVASTARSEEEAEQDAAYALEGATPYGLNELAFDWSLDDGQLFIAAVARETLAEAESFATEHDFSPTSFVGLPEQNAFPGEPFFGIAKAAKATISSSDMIARDLQPIQVIGMATVPDPEPEPEPVSAPLPEQTSTPAKAELPAAPPLPTLTDETEPAPEADPAPALSFSSVRNGHNTPSAAKTPDLESVAAPTIAPEPASVTDAPTADDQTAADAPVNTPATFLSRRGSPAKPQPVAEKAPQAAPEPAPTTKPKKTAKEPKKPVVQPVPPAPADPPPVETESSAASVEPASEQERLTVFGQRKSEEKPRKVGGKPKFLGFALTAMLLIFLAAAAIWASLNSPGGVASLFGSEPEQIELATATPVDPNVATEEEIAEAADVEPAGEVDPAITEGPAVLLPETPQVLTPEEAERRYVATGIWQIAPEQPDIPLAEDDGEVYLVSIDPQVRTVDAIALPDVSKQHDDAPSERLSPAAPGTTYDVDNRGLVKATPDGALTPDGVRIFAGKPPAYPTAFPERTIGGMTAEERAALGRVRPKARPDNLRENTERGQLGGRTRSELAGIRPKARPDWIGQKTDEADAAGTDNAGTAQAVAVSLRPKLRPANFDSLVAKTKASVEASTEVAAAAVAPSIPSSASVARQATVKNALNLRKLNLIGVSGKSNARKALVRTAAGRFKTVEVGDRLDGGKVSAITETELRYTKNGKNIVLKLPRG